MHVCIYREKEGSYVLFTVFFRYIHINKANLKIRYIKRSLLC